MRISGLWAQQSMSARPLEVLLQQDCCNNKIQRWFLEAAFSSTLAPCFFLHRQIGFQPSHFAGFVLVYSRSFSVSIFQFGLTFLAMKYKSRSGWPICLLPLHWEWLWATECAVSSWTTLDGDGLFTSNLSSCFDMSYRHDKIDKIMTSVNRGLYL